MPRKHTPAIIPKQPTAPVSPALVEDQRQLIAEARRTVAVTVNAGLTLLYWRIGKRAAEDVLGKERAAYGRQIVVSPIRQLSWTHFIALLALKNSLQRDFYTELCRIERMERQHVSHIRTGRGASLARHMDHLSHKVRTGATCLALLQLLEILKRSPCATSSRAGGRGKS